MADILVEELEAIKHYRYLVNLRYMERLRSPYLRDHSDEERRSPDYEYVVADSSIIGGETPPMKVANDFLFAKNEEYGLSRMRDGLYKYLNEFAIERSLTVQQRQEFDVRDLNVIDSSSNIFELHFRESLRIIFRFSELTKTSAPSFRTIANAYLTQINANFRY